MGLSPSQKRTLRKKSAINHLEAEDLLRVAVRGDAADTLLLRELDRKHNWPRKGTRIVPLGLWNDAVCCFLESGYNGLVELATVGATRLRYLEFCTAVLEHLKTSQSIDALIEIGGSAMRSPGEDLSLSLLITDAFNLILSFDKAPEIDSKVATTIRQFLHKMLRLDLVEHQRVSVVCALRGVGDEESLLLIQELAELEYPYTGTKASAIHQIRKRLQRGG